MTAAYVPTVWHDETGVGDGTTVTAVLMNKIEQGIAAGNAVTVPIDPWHSVGAVGEPAFSAGCSNTPPEQALQFRKDPLGKVQLRGYVTGPPGGGGVFTLPVAYRPPAAVRFAIATVQSNVPVVSWGYVTVAGLVVVAAVSGFATPTVWDMAAVEFDTDTVTQMPTGPQGAPGPSGANGAGAFVGQIVPSALKTPPPGWLMCDGNPLFAGTHPTLRALLIADGSIFGTLGSDPLLPDLTSRMVQGAITDFGSFGKKGGESSHVLLMAEMPAHDHTGNTQSGAAPDHTHVLSAGTVYMDIGGGAGFIASGGPRWAFSGAGNTGGSDRPLTHTHPITAAGGGAVNTGNPTAHNNLPPYLNLFYLIYAGD